MNYIVIISARMVSLYLSISMSICTYVSLALSSLSLSLSLSPSLSLLFSHLSLSIYIYIFLSLSVSFCPLSFYIYYLCLFSFSFFFCFYLSPSLPPCLSLHWFLSLSPLPSPIFSRSKILSLCHSLFFFILLFMCVHIYMYICMPVCYSAGAYFKLETRQHMLKRHSDWRAGNFFLVSTLNNSPIHVNFVTPRFPHCRTGDA